jgi:hypothetical protein
LPSAWLVAPEDHAGVSITISDRGNVLLTQDRLFTDKAVICLHTDEARALLELLPDAIAAADEQRKGTQ